MSRRPNAVRQLDDYYTNCILAGNVFPDASILVDCFRMKKIDRLWTLVAYYEDFDNIDVTVDMNGNRVEGKIDFLDIPSYVEVIGEKAFLNANFTNVSISKNVRIIGDRAFVGCESLKKIVINGNKLKSIGANAFAICKSLECFTLPESIRKIGHSAFLGCHKLREVVIKSNMLTVIPDDAFNRCDSLEKINIPEGVKSIGVSAFANCKKLNSVNLPDTVEEIADCAFMNCYELKDIPLPSKLRNIGELSFSDCCNLDIREIPASVTEIGIWAFWDTATKEVIIHSADIILRSAFESNVQIYSLNRLSGELVKVEQRYDKRGVMAHYMQHIMAEKLR